MTLKLACSWSSRYIPFQESAFLPKKILSLSSVSGKGIYPLTDGAAVARVYLKSNSRKFLRSMGHINQFNEDAADATKWFL